MKRKIVVLLACLCVSGLCACGTKNQTQKVADTQTVNTEKTKDTENTETIPEKSTEESSETDEFQVISFDPESPKEYRGKELQLSYTEEESIVKVKYGDAEYEIQDYVEWIDTGYIMEKDDAGFYTIIQLCTANDWVTSYILKYDGKGFKEVAAQNGGVMDASAISGNQISFSTRVDVFGTYGVTIPMKLENDQLTSVDDLIKFYNEPDPEIYDSMDSPEGKAVYNQEGYSVLTLNQKLKAMSDDGDIEIEKGQQIIPYGYNEKEKKFYFTYQDKQYYFVYQEAGDGYTLTIDGVDQDDMFVYLPYSG